MKLDLAADHTIYRSSEGKRLPSVTTCLKVLAKHSLLKWYAAEERKGVLACLKEGFPLPEGPFAERKRDHAANLGTIVHARIEGFLKADPLDLDGLDPEMHAQSEAGYMRFVDWWISNGFSILESEKVMVHEDFPHMAFGGTADIIALDRDKRFTLIDIKTSNKSRYWPYPEVYAQVSAYAMMYEFETNAHIDRIVVVRVGKDENDDLQVVEVDAHKRDWGYRLFRSAYYCHMALKELQD